MWTFDNHTYIAHTGDQTQLGICYFEGHGVENNPIIGAWYLYAAVDQDWQRAIDIIRENDIPRPTEEELDKQIRS